MDQKLKKHIVMIVAWFPYKEKKTGIFIQEQIKSIGDNCAISVITVNMYKLRGLLPFIKISNTKEENYTRYDVRIFTPISRFWIDSFLIKFAYKKVISIVFKKLPIDLFHIHVRNDITKMVTSPCIIRDIPLIVTEHWSFYQTGIQSLPLKQREKTIHEIKTWYSNPAIKAVLPVSNMLGDIMHTRYGINPNIVMKIGNVSTSCFTYVQRKKREPEHINIVLAASWYYPKNPMLFVNALKKIAQKIAQKVNIHWIGSGPLLEDVKTALSEGFENVDFVFYGLVSKSKIAEVFGQCDFLVHPTDSENLPTIIAEALCSGLPILSNNVGGIPEMINQSNGILVQAQDLNGFSEALFELVKNHNKYVRQTISSDAKKLYSADAIGKQLIAIYNRSIDAD